MKRDFIFLLILALIVAGCQYEVSPWQTDANCSSDLSIAANIEKLKAYEERVGSKSEYQVAIVSDPQQYPGAFEEVIEHINGLPEVDFILLTGDLAETGIKAEFEWTCKAMEKAKQPIFAIIGNHDAISFGKDIWADTFGPEDYSFTYQNSKFIAYNDNKYEYENVPDRAWLAEETENASSFDYIIAASHVPPWPTDLAISQDLKDLGVDLTIHGHESRFDFWQLSNVMLPHYVTSFTKEKAFGLLTVNPSGLTMQNCILGQCEVVQPRTRN
ncbi:metallophosphoesterase family protein [Bermanella sp. R86510]|uniref:metallophosphoesterase family protein n=1 Tax=unclassified Bermanella TaxID=2627862 RepID=UPI0037C739B3